MATSAPDASPASQKTEHARSSCALQVAATDGCRCVRLLASVIGPIEAARVFVNHIGIKTFRQR